MEGRPLDEADLIVRASRGDEQAYGELVSRHSVIAYRTALLLTGSTAEAEDAAQEGFIAAWRSLHRFRSTAPFRPWLLRIVANAARNRRRGEARRARAELKLADASSHGVAAPSPEAEVEHAEERRALLRAVDALDDADRRVIVCRYFLDLDVAETAAALGCREGTVKSRTARALRRLEHRMSAEAAT